MKINGATPANWMPCDKIIEPMPTNFTELQKRKTEIEKNKSGMSWYLNYKKPVKCVNAKTINQIEKTKQNESYKLLEENNKIERKDL